MSEHRAVDDLVATYLTVRNAIEDKKLQQKAELLPLEEQFETLSEQLLDACNAVNADSIRTATGTVSRRVQSRYWTSDWESMYKFIRDNDAPFLLEQRIHNSNMKQFLEANPDQLPMGLQAERKYVVQVRKPTNKEIT